MMVIEAHRNSEGQGLAAIQRWPTPQSKLWTKDFLALARKDDNIIAVIAVGSAVRPAVASMDLDLVVIAKDPARLKTKPPIEIDLRAYARRQVDSLLESGNDLLGWAIMYGKVLLQKDGFWALTLKHWRNRVPLPSPEIAAGRAADALRRYSNMLDIGDEDAAYEQAVSYVTHLARAELLKRNLYPASRPELPKELRSIGCNALADCLEGLMKRAVSSPKELIDRLETESPNTRRKVQ